MKRLVLIITVCMLLALGERTAAPSENIVVQGCEMKDGNGGVVMGSEISGGVRNVFARDCRMDSSNLNRLAELWKECGRILRDAPLFLVRSGARPIFGNFPQNKKLCELLAYRALTNEAEGIRTLNLRIDSLRLAP